MKKFYGKNLLILVQIPCFLVILSSCKTAQEGGSSSINANNTKSAGPVPFKPTIAVGYDKGCAYTRTGIRCWGTSGGGNGIKPPREILMNTKDIGSPNELGIGDEDRFCAIVDSDKVVCWNEKEKWFPLEVSPGKPRILKNPRSLYLSQKDGCLASDEGMACWGSMAKNLNDGIPKNLGPLKKVSAYWDSYCALDDKNLRCWGEKSIGVPSGINKPEGYSVSGGQGNDQTTCLWGQGRLACENFGDGFANGKGPMPAPPELQEITHAVATPFFVCGYGKIGGLTCWSKATSASSTPKKFSVPLDGKLLELKSSGLFGCALTTEAVTCFGYDQGLNKLIPPDDIDVKTVNDLSPL